MLNLCIYHKDVSFIIDKNITRHYIPNLVLTVPETAICSAARCSVGYFPHLALRHFLVELVEKCHDSSFFSCFRCKIKHKF